MVICTERMRTKMIIKVEKSCEKPNIIHQVLLNLYGPGSHSITTLQPIYRLLFLRATLIAYQLDVADLKNSMKKTGTYPLKLKTALDDYHEYQIKFNQAERVIGLDEYIQSNHLDRESEYKALGEWYQEAHKELLNEDLHAAENNALKG